MENGPPHAFSASPLSYKRHRQLDILVSDVQQTVAEGIRDSYQAHFWPLGHKNAADAGLQCRIWSKNGREMPKVRLHGIGTLCLLSCVWVGTTLSAYGVSARRKNRSQNILKPVLRIMAHECQSSLTTGAELAGESVSGWFSFCPAGFTVVCCAMGSVLSCAPLVPCGGLCTMTTFEGMGFFMAIVFYE